jgi:hypothetical protein
MLGLFIKNSFNIPIFTGARSKKTVSG